MMQTCHKGALSATQRLDPAHDLMYVEEWPLRDLHVQHKSNASTTTPNIHEPSPHKNTYMRASHFCPKGQTAQAAHAQKPQGKGAVS